MLRSYSKILNNALLFFKYIQVIIHRVRGSQSVHHSSTGRCVDRAATTVAMREKAVSFTANSKIYQAAVCRHLALRYFTSSFGREGMA